MHGSSPLHLLMASLRQYKQKFYINQILKGSLIAVGLVLSTYLLFNTLEFFARFPSWLRGFLFFSFLGLLAGSVIYWILIPAGALLKIRRQLSDEEAARQIGNYFPEVEDKLLNTIQLQKLSTQENALVQASIAQRSQSLMLVRFQDAVQYAENRRYLRYAIPPAALILILLLIAPQFFTETTARIIYFNRKTPTPSAPFSFQLQTKNLQAFKNEDFHVSLKMEGKSLPLDVYLWAGGRRYKMEKKDTQTFAYTFNKLQKSTDFHFEAAGFQSTDYQIALVERPMLLSFDAQLVYPAYLGKTNETWNNVGNLIVPEGTQITWRFNTNESDKVWLIFNEKEETEAVAKQSRLFELQKTARQSANYQIRLKNKYAENKDEINFFIQVIPDQFPTITMQAFRDEQTFNLLSLGGNVSDDYGLSQLKLFYRIEGEGKNNAWQAINLPLVGSQTIQNFYYQLELDKLNLKPSDRLFYFVQVWDNDGVNGAKSAKTTVQEFKVPNKQDLAKDIDETAKKAEDDIKSSSSKSKQIQNKIDNMEQKLRTKQSVDYQDKKMLEELIKEREELNQEIQELQELNEQLREKQERFAEPNPEIQQKMDKLQKHMDELLDEETKKLYQELQKMLEQNRNSDDIINMLQRIERQENSLEKELERALEMFKQMQFDQKLDQVQKDLSELAEKQEELAEKNENKEMGKDEMLQEQESLNQEFDELQKEIDELQDMNEQLEKPHQMEDPAKQEQDIKQEQQNSKQQLQENKNKQAQQSQKKAAQKMKELAEQMEQMQQDMEMEQMQENMDDLRAILENLVTLSFDQERLMKDFKAVNTSDPRYKELAQEQLKLQNDAQIIEDSLYALSKRMFQIESFVTRELKQMKDYMRESAANIKERKVNVATGKQQFAMTSMNNLALLLNDILQQMQDAMANAMAMPSNQNSKNKKNKGTSISQLQDQLNQKIQELKNSQKTGRQLSEELAKLAAEQERIRRALREMEEKAGNSKEGKEQLTKQLQELKKMMEETEKDLVNKNLNENTIKRQKEIQTRLLESEKALKEQDEDEERKGETAKTKTKIVPPNLKQLFDQKQKQIELLKTVPPQLSPYFKKEVDEYFEKIDK